MLLIGQKDFHGFRVGLGTSAVQTKREEKDEPLAVQQDIKVQDASQGIVQSATGMRGGCHFLKS
ncbi:hypothetical protein D4L85_22215 [Chryseolinea soli]|uniref:Uncharacterized protein n=1 Tax=Chryseolinea soli TaxID=2321403 RepID=A0A385SSK5_9BACT|nr:hypothetical protein D4L85_22215 [Chryseolinea soli]